MNVHIINRKEAWPTAKPLITPDDLVVWTDTDDIANLSEDFKSVGAKIVRLNSDDGPIGENKDFPVISDQAWVQYVLDSTTVCSWG